MELDYCFCIFRSCGGLCDDEAARGRRRWEESVGKKEIIFFNVAQAVAHVLAWGLVAPVLDILIYAEPVEKLFAQGLMASVSNIITTGVVGTLLLLGYAKTVVKRGSLTKED